VNGRAAARWRLAVTAGLAAYGIYHVLRPSHYGLLGHVDLAIHETGHLVFAPFGEFLGYAGGTLLQLLLPCAFVWYFHRRGDPFGAAVSLWWVAQNLWNVATYVGDARAQELPLVGGGDHDWAYLLDALGWLERDRTLAQVVRIGGIVVFVVAIVRALAHSGARSAEPEVASDT
jgi:hypothetical protein